MKKTTIYYICIVLLGVFPFFAHAAANETGTPVRLDFEMVEKGIQWLEFINTGADETEIKKYFMTHVAPTGGCQSIIHHWARFMEWNNQLFYKFIMTALGRIPTDAKLTNDDGTPTMFAHRRKLWKNALANPGALKKELELLRKANFTKHAVEAARRYLPPEASLKADFYFVLFGHSTAFSVGKENGFDILQLPRKKDGTLDIDEISRTVTHELHHTGFSFLTKKFMKDAANNRRLLLPGILTAEGMPTYFIDQTWKHLETYRNGKSKIYRAVANDWTKHSARLPELYRQAQQDIRLSLEGKLTAKDLMGRWMSGVKGAAYVLGADMMKVIDTYLGKEAVLELAKDSRQLLLVYNRAAKKAEKKGKTLFRFDPALARQLTEVAGSE